MTGQLRQAVIHTRQKLATSVRRTCRVIGLARSSLQYQPAQKDRDDEDLRLVLIRLAKQDGCYGQHDEAVAAAKKAFELNPGDINSNNFGAISFMLVSRDEEARAAFTKLIRVKPQYLADGHLNGLGIGCFLAGKYDEAIDAFERNIELGGPLGPGALAFWTASCIEAGRVDDAESKARQPLEFAPQFSISGFRFAHLLKNRDDTDRMVNALRQAGLSE
jgi:Flp pilus assembly protein TadD